jgi:signal transduction histidine kinase
LPNCNPYHLCKKQGDCPLTETQRRATRRVDRDLHAVGLLAQAILDGEDSESLLTEVARAAQDLVDAKVTMVVTVDDDTNIGTVRALVGLSGGPVSVGDSAPLEGTPISAVLRTGTPAIWAGPQDVSPDDRAIMDAYGVGPVVAVPLASEGRVRGVLFVGKAAGAPRFRQPEIDLIATFGKQASSALHSAELRAFEASQALRGERDRIARDLHDGVVQSLFGLGMSLRATIDRSETPDQARIITDALTALDDAIVSIRDYIALLQEGAATRSKPPAIRTPAPPAIRSQRRPPRDAISALGGLAEATLAGRGLPSVLAQVVQTVLEQSRAHFTVLGTLVRDGQALEIRAVAGRDIAGRRVGNVIPLGQTLAAEAIRQGRPVVIATPDQADRALKLTLGRLGMGPVVSVPMSVRGRPFGGLAVGRSAGSQPFSRIDVNVIEASAVQAAIALEFDRVRTELERNVLSDERRRVGSDLHERVIQTLFRAGLNLQSVVANIQDASVRMTVRSAVDAIDRAIRDLRRYVFDLGPTNSVDRSLELELRSMASDLVAGAPITLTVDVEPNILARVAPWHGDLLQIAREATANVVQHAHATQCIVRLVSNDGNAVLEVFDDGTGFSGGVGARGHGVANMRARAAAVGGRVQIRRNRPRGTVVKVSVPLYEA